MDDYISKPVDRKKLYEIIAKWTMVRAKHDSRNTKHETTKHETETETETLVFR